MPKKLLTLLLPAIVISFNSTAASADDKYPAADFKPTVVYLDKSHQAADAEKSQASTKKRETSKADANYPAANFEPKVLYIDEKAAESKKASSVKRETSKPDPKYPAANFEPKVIYP